MATPLPSSGNALVPCDSTGEIINEGVYRQLLRYMSDAGTNVFIGGPHATEFVNMDASERRRLWEIGVEEIKGQGSVNAIPLGPASTTSMIRSFELAKELGFDGAQLYPGAQDGRGMDGLFIAEAERYFRDVLEAVDLPMYLCGYHGGEIIDSPTKQVPDELLITLAKDYPHIVGVTITDRPDEAGLVSLIEELGRGCPVRLAGSLDWLGRMKLGVYGFHSIQQSIAPRLCSRMMDAFHDGRFEEARPLAERIRHLNEIVHDGRAAYPRSIKPIMNHLGFPVGSIRRPYLSLDERVCRDIERRLDALNLATIEDLPRSRALRAAPRREPGSGPAADAGR